MIFLIRILFKLFDDMIDCQQYAFDQQYAINNNFNLCKILIDIIDEN